VRSALPGTSVAFYADDFTGAADAIGQYARSGMSGMLLFGLPDDAVLAQLSQRFDVVGIAGVARALTPAELPAELDPVFDAFARLSPEFVQYKTSSTFDSSANVGSVGAAIDLAIQRFGDHTVPVLVAQPEIGRFTVFGNHFAAAGDGEVYRLDRQPLASSHRITPMGEADLRLHLAGQTDRAVRGIPLSLVAGEEVHLEARWNAEQTKGGLVVIDSFTEDDIRRVGRVIVHRQRAGVNFVVGSGGLSRALSTALAAGDGTAADGPPVGRASGPVLALSGSASEHTRHQVERALEMPGWSGIAVNPDDVRDPVAWEMVSARAADLLSTGQDVLVFVRPDSGRVREAIDPRLLGSSLGHVVKHCIRGDVSRVVLAGGDTSGFALKEMGAYGATVIPARVEAAVPLISLLGEEGLNGLEAILKGGQVGSLDFFETARGGSASGVR
jgi:uncharacterized protein YgbK (DUF1537 family)